MRIGILETGLPPEGVEEEFGDYPAMFTRLLGGHGFEFRTWSVVRGEFPESVADADGWLITGSRHGAYEDHDWIPRLEDFIRAVRADGRPMVGICFGHQIIAQALGGKVEKFGGGWSVGRTIYRFGDRDVALNAWHQDQVVEKPAGAEVLASSDFCPYAGLAYDDRILTVQAHPEYAPAFIGALIRLRGKAIPQPLTEAAIAQFDQPLDSDWVGDRLADFLLEHQKRS